jgi:lipoate-protein ligase B
MHGLSLNVNCKLNHFAQIMPCGISESEAGVCRIMDLCADQVQPNIMDVKSLLLQAIQKVFTVHLESGNANELSRATACDKSVHTTILTRL